MILRDPKSAKVWSDSDDAFLQKLWGKESTDLISARLGRSVLATRNRAWKILGTTSNPAD